MDLLLEGFGVLLVVDYVRDEHRGLVGVVCYDYRLNIFDEVAFGELEGRKLVDEVVVNGGAVTTD